MLIDDIQEQLKKLEPDIQTIKTFWTNAGIDQQLADLGKKSEDPSLWNSPQQPVILKELQALKNKKESYTEVTSQFTETCDMTDLFKDDDKELTNIAQELPKLKRLINNFKVQLLLNGEHDKSNCFLSINAGAGGTESQDWAEILLRMYVRFCERERYTVSVLDQQVGEGAGIKSATLFVKGNNAYGMLKSEYGIHRLVRISPYDANKKRHTSFASVHIVPEIADVEFTIEPDDLRIDTYRAGGAGGQHVNKTESAIRITHIPTGIVVQCQNERSQGQNKEIALKMLKSKLAQKAQEERDARAASMEKKNIGWGSQIRSYVLHPYKMVKDHRTDFESPQPDLVLDGELIDFIEAYLVQQK